MGIDVDRAHRIAFALGSGITAIAGGLLATNYPFHPFVGVEYVIVMYAGVVLGGMGSIIGAFWGGMTIGLVQQMSTLILPTQLQNAAIFVVFLLIIFFRPQGFFGRMVGADMTMQGFRWLLPILIFTTLYAVGVAERHQFVLPAGVDAGSGLGSVRPVVEPAQRIYRTDLVRSRGFLRNRRLYRRTRSDLFRPVAMGRRSRSRQCSAASQGW